MFPYMNVVWILMNSNARTRPGCSRLINEQMAAALWGAVARVSDLTRGSCSEEQGGLIVLLADLHRWFLHVSRKRRSRGKGGRERREGGGGGGRSLFSRQSGAEQSGTFRVGLSPDNTPELQLLRACSQHWTREKQNKGKRRKEKSRFSIFKVFYRCRSGITDN